MKKLLPFLIMIIPVMISCSVKESNKMELVVDLKSDFGSGAFWNHKTGELMWVDVTGKILNFYSPRKGHNKEMFIGQIIGAAVPAESGQVIAALQNGIYLIDPLTGTKRLISAPEDTVPENRFNSGKCDPAGRFWAGTVNMDMKQGMGKLYRLDSDSTVHEMLEYASIPNGTVWSGDNTKMFYMDSPTQKVIAYDYDNETGEISNGKTAVEIPPEIGLPYGMTIDADNNLWIAIYGGAAVTCWNPETGEMLHEIKVPAKNVTSCAFGDEDFGTLYITTARQETDSEELKKYPHAGGVFKIRPGVYGVKSAFFKGEFESEF
jgi:sugar lactone lactonase YvrE